MNTKRTAPSKLENPVVEIETRYNQCDICELSADVSNCVNCQHMPMHDELALAPHKHRIQPDGEYDSYWWVHTHDGVEVHITLGGHDSDHRIEPREHTHDHPIIEEWYRNEFNNKWHTMTVVEGFHVIRDTPATNQMLREREKSLTVVSAPTPPQVTVNGYDVDKSADMITRKRMSRHDTISEQLECGNYYMDGYWLGYDEGVSNMQPIIPPSGVGITDVVVSEPEWNWIQGYMDGFALGTAKRELRERRHNKLESGSPDKFNLFAIEREQTKQMILDGTITDIEALI